jgi:biotin-dependent carboxylase-like uncharacterized protein
MSGGTLAVVVVDSGLLSTVQDLGRSGVGSMGVSPSGAADWFAARAANRLVGNPDGAALIESTLTGLSFDVRRNMVIAVTGAEAPVTIGRMRGSTWRSYRARAGERIVVGAAARGLRTYVAFRGGVGVPLVLGGASTDVGGGFGGRVLAAGDAIEVGGAGVETEQHRDLEYPADALAHAHAPAVLRATIGPDAEHLGSHVVDALFSGSYIATSRSSRQALRLDGASVAPRSATDRVSAGVSAGCVQLTGDGLPVVLLAEHQTTGGYPVAICVVWADVPRAAQIRPGEAVTFVRVDWAQARHALVATAAALRSLRLAADVAGGVDEASLARGFFEGA